MIQPLNNRQKGLYKYLLTKSTSTSDFISKEEICKDLEQLYPRSSEKRNEHNSTIYSWIRADIKAINDQPEGDYKIVASNKDGYKIANREEAEKYLSRRFKANLRALKRTNQMAKKLGLNGQFDILKDTEVRTVIGDTL